MMPVSSVQTLGESNQVTSDTSDDATVLITWFFSTQGTILHNATQDKAAMRQEKEGVYEGHGPPARQTTRPDLLRLTRHVLQVAELLPWPVKDILYHVNSFLTERVTRGNQVFWRGRS